MLRCRGLPLQVEQMEHMAWRGGDSSSARIAARPVIKQLGRGMLTLRRSVHRKRGACRVPALCSRAVRKLLERAVTEKKRQVVRLLGYAGKVIWSNFEPEARMRGYPPCW